MSLHHQEYLNLCADAIGRPLSPELAIHALDCLAFEATTAAKGLVRAMKEVEEMTHRYTESSLSFGVIGKLAREALDATPKLEGSPGRSVMEAAISKVESAHFRSATDTGAASQAMTVWNALRAELGMPPLSRDDLGKAAIASRKAAVQLEALELALAILNKVPESTLEKACEQAAVKHVNGSPLFYLQSVIQEAREN